MGRAWRIEYEGALYHILSRGNEQNDIFYDDQDRLLFLETIGEMSGHLFQGRFKSIIVQNDAYLMRLSCYIHRNPLRAGIVKRLADYRWNSYKVYAYGNKAGGTLCHFEMPCRLFVQRILVMQRKEIQK